MNQPNLDHARHDLTLIAGHAAGDLVDPDRDRVDALLASCLDCSDLHRDLLAIAAATRSLPAPRAPARDFRLTPAQAERLRRGSWLRTALRPFGAPRSAARPMAAAFTSLGIAGLLVATALPALFGGSAAMFAPTGPSSGGAEAGGAAATAAPAYVTAAPAPQDLVPTSNTGGYAIDTNGSAAPGPTTAGVKAASAPPSTPGAVAVGGSDTGSGNDGASPPGSVIASSPPNLLAVGSLALLALGLVLFGLRFAGRRIR